MKNLILILAIFIFSSPKFTFAQNYEVGGMLGPRKKTDIIMIGNDETTFYNVRIDREKNISMVHWKLIP